MTLTGFRCGQYIALMLHSWFVCQLSWKVILLLVAKSQEYFCLLMYSLFKLKSSELHHFFTFNSPSEFVETTRDVI